VSKAVIDYIVFFSIITGMLLILLSFFTIRNFGIAGCIIIAIAFLSEIILRTFH